jgi:hypothetical protein
MLNHERREKMMNNSGIKHGVAEARANYGDIKKGQTGIITAYLPDENKFCVFWGSNVGFVTYNYTEDKFDEYFKLSSMDEVLYE